MQTDAGSVRVVSKPWLCLSNSCDVDKYAVGAWRGWGGARVLAGFKRKCSYTRKI